MTRLIDVPIESLPHIDEHTIDIDAAPERVWEALLRSIAGATGNEPSTRLARALGCAHTERQGEPGRIGSTVPGFVVARAVAPAVLALMGEHRFSRYALIFRIAEQPGGSSVLSAESRAEFPGRRGSLYRAAVIGTRAHVLATKGILHAVRRAARNEGR